MDVDFEHLPKVGFSTELYKNSELAITLQNKENEICVHLFKGHLDMDLLKIKKNQKE
jgi:hypothetical protein